MFERGGVQKGWGVWGSSPRRKQIQSFKFDWLKWPILAEMTAKSGIYFHFLCQQGEGPSLAETPLYAFHTHPHIKSKFPNHINFIYLSGIYEEIIHQFSYVGFVLRNKRLCYYWGMKTVDSQHIDSESFHSQHGTLTRCWFDDGQRRRRWSNIKTTLGQISR